MAERRLNQLSNHLHLSDHNQNEGAKCPYANMTASASNLSVPIGHTQVECLLVLFLAVGSEMKKAI
jgi:hypothetical protein